MGVGGSRGTVLVSQRSSYATMHKEGLLRRENLGQPRNLANVARVCRVCLGHLQSSNLA